MGIRFRCHLCRAELHVKDYLAGKRGRCPECRGSFRIPAKDSEFSLRPDDRSAIVSDSPNTDIQADRFRPLELPDTEPMASSIGPSIGEPLDVQSSQSAPNDPSIASLTPPNLPGTVVSRDYEMSFTGSHSSVGHKNREVRRQKRQRNYLILVVTLVVVLVGLLGGLLMVLWMQFA